MQAEAAHQKFKYEKLNKYFTKRRTSKEETVLIDEILDSDYVSSSESENESNETEKIYQKISRTLKNGAEPSSNCPD